jgi:hypothetical protein
MIARTYLRLREFWYNIIEIYTDWRIKNLSKKLRRLRKIRKNRGMIEIEFNRSDSTRYRLHRR